MRPGTRVAGRWVVEEELPPAGDLRRFRVRDGESVAEAVAPAGHVLLRPGVREAFARQPLPDHPAAIGTLATDSVDGLPVRVRPATRGTIEGARLSPADAVALAGWLAPAILAGSGSGELGDDDLVVDTDSIVRLAPNGIPRAESVARVPRHRAPEGAPTPEADLYGLGVTLYRAVTGAWPSVAAPGEPPRHAIPASAHGVPADADALLAGLLSPDPAARRAAVEGLPDAPFRLPEGAIAAPPAPTKATTPAIRTTTSSPAPLSSATTALLPWAVLVPLKGLTPAQLRVVAARSVADPEAVRRAATKGATWCVDVAPTEAEAGRILSRLESAGVKGGELVMTKAPRVVQYFLLAVVAFVIGLVSGLLLPFGGLAAVLVYLGMVNVRGMFAVANTRMSIQERDRAALPETAPEARVRALRRRVAAAELPEIVLSDLRADVARLEARLDTLRAHEAELTGADASLKDRQDRVAADLASVEADLARLDADLTRALTSDLDDLGAPAAPPAMPRALDMVPEDEPPPTPPRPRQSTKA